MGIVMYAVDDSREESLRREREQIECIASRSLEKNFKTSYDKSSL